MPTTAVRLLTLVSKACFVTGESWIFIPVPAPPRKAAILVRTCLGERLGVSEQTRFCVPVRYRRAQALERPRDGESGVVPEDGALVLGGVVVGGLVEDVGRLRQDEEAVREAGGNPGHVLGLAGEGEVGPAAEGGRAPAQGDGAVPDLAPGDADQLSLRLADLVVQAAHDAAPGMGVVVLHEVAVEADRPCDLAPVVALEEVAARVLEDARLDDEEIRNDLVPGDLHQK